MAIFEHNGSRIETLDPRDVPFKDIHPDRTVFLMRSPYADSAMEAGAGSYVIGIGGQHQMMAVARERDGFEVAAMVEFRDRRQAVDGAMAHDANLFFLGNVGQVNVFPGSRNMALVTEAFFDVANAPGAKIVYDGGVAGLGERDLKRGEFVTVNRAGAREASPPDHPGITREEVLAEKWLVSSVSGDRVGLSPTNGNPYSRSISADVRNVARFDPAEAANARARHGDRDGYREMMTVRANGTLPRDRRSLAAGDVVMLGTRAARQASDEAEIGYASRAAGVPWRVEGESAGVVKLSAYVGGRPVAAHLRDPGVVRLDAADLSGLAILASMGADRDLAASLVAATEDRSSERDVRSAGSMELKVRRSELALAISLLRGVGAPSSSGDVAGMLADMAPAIRQEQWAAKEPGGDMVRTGKVTSGLSALEALHRGFGSGEYRKVAFDPGHASRLAAAMGPAYVDSHERVVLDLVDRGSRDSGKVQASPSRSVGASR